MTNKHTALRLVETCSLAGDEWLDVRKQGIGSSDAAAAVGLCPYKCRLELWMEKTGRSSGFQPGGQDDPTYWGTLLEPYVASVYSQRTGRRVRKVNAVLQHPTFSFMLANIDREVGGCPEVQILECKTTLSANRKAFRVATTPSCGQAPPSRRDWFTLLPARRSSGSRDRRAAANGRDRARRKWPVPASVSFSSLSTARSACGRRAESQPWSPVGRSSNTVAVAR